MDGKSMFNFLSGLQNRFNKFLALVLMLLLSACTSDKAPPQTQQSTPQQETPSTAANISWYGLKIDKDFVAATLDKERAEISTSVVLLEGVELGEIPVSIDKDKQLILLKQDGDEENGQQPPEQPPEIYSPIDGSDEVTLANCEVMNASLMYGGGTQTHAPLQFPRFFTSPAPGGNPRITGPTSGPIPGVNATVVGNSFEYHSDLNNIHGCTSEQRKQFLLVFARNQGNSGVVNGFGGGGIRAGQGALDNYQGNTQTGVRNGPAQMGGVPLYEGTPAKIHWVDTPRMLGQPRANFNNRVAMMATLVTSFTYDANGTNGWVCLSGHTFILAYNAAGNPSVMNANAARAYLNGLTELPQQPNEPLAQFKGRQRLTKQAKTLAAQGGFQGQTNPEFRDLGCYPF